MHKAALQISSAASCDNSSDPVFAAIARHRRAFVQYLEHIAHLADNSTTIEDVASVEAEALNALLDCPATTRAGVEAAIRYIATLAGSGWQLPGNSDDEFAKGCGERRFLQACCRALDRMT